MRPLWAFKFLTSEFSLSFYRWGNWDLGTKICPRLYSQELENLKCRSPASWNKAPSLWLMALTHHLPVVLTKLTNVCAISAFATKAASFCWGECCNNCDYVTASSCALPLPPSGPAHSPGQTDLTALLSWGKAHVEGGTFFCFCWLLLLLSPPMAPAKNPHSKCFRWCKWASLSSGEILLIIQSLAQVGPPVWSQLHPSFTY